MGRQGRRARVEQKVAKGMSGGVRVPVTSSQTARSHTTQAHCGGQSPSSRSSSKTGALQVG